MPSSDKTSAARQSSDFEGGEETKNKKFATAIVEYGKVFIPAIYSCLATISLFGFRLNHGWSGSFKLSRFLPAVSSTVWDAAAPIYGLLLEAGFYSRK